jgi:hypothetical protein
MRACERAVGAAGKTPAKRPGVTARKPFAGFVESGLDLFDALVRAGVPLISLDPAGRLGEVYPGDLWPLLAGPGLRAGTVLPKKSSPSGWRIRRALLETVGVRFGRSLAERNHDQLDACLGAVVAAARREAIPGLRAVAVGTPVFREGGGILREGEMFRLEVTDDSLRVSIREAMRPLTSELVGVGDRRTPRKARAAIPPRASLAELAREG